MTADNELKLQILNMSINNYPTRRDPEDVIERAESFYKWVDSERQFVKKPFSQWERRKMTIDQAKAAYEKAEQDEVVAIAQRRDANHRRLAAYMDVVAAQLDADYEEGLNGVINLCKTGK